jgi:NTP pyrophosphatase (non-canonical NTP hydrolase)
MSDNNYTTLRAANRARQLEWDKNAQITPAYRGNELAGEMGEVLERALDLIVLAAAAGRVANTIKKLERERLGIGGSRSTVAQLAEELADLKICADLVAMSYDIDLEQATRDKFNATSEMMGLKTRYVAPRQENDDVFKGFRGNNEA